MDIDAGSQGSQYTEVCIALRVHSRILTKFISFIRGVYDVNENYSNVINTILLVQMNIMKCKHARCALCNIAQARVFMHNIMVIVLKKNV